MRTCLRLLALFTVIASLSLNVGPAAAGKKYDEILSSWRGADISRVIRSWGPPSSVYTSPNGEQTYTWVKVNGRTMTGEATRELFGSTSVTAQYREDSCRTSLVVGTLTGVGLGIEKKKDGILVREASVDMPAGQAGIWAEDVILAIDGASTKDMSLQEFAGRVKAAAGVSLTVKRKKEKAPLEFRVTAESRKDRVLTYSWEGRCF
jgi:C-terminal processing protease CtpA/Prc